MASPNHGLGVYQALSTIQGGEAIREAPEAGLRHEVRIAIVAPQTTSVRPK
ncbi:MAG: hypothetical protein R3C10_16280 [Pirellulales bacterium]